MHDESLLNVFYCSLSRMTKIRVYQDLLRQLTCRSSVKMTDLFDRLHFNSLVDRHLVTKIVLRLL